MIPRALFVGTPCNQARGALLTRRVTLRKFLLLPSHVVKKICRYVLGEAQDRFGVLIHAFVFMGNHYHCLFTDVHANAPAFYEFLHPHLGRAMNKHRGRKEKFLGGSGSAVSIDQAHAR